MPLVNVTIARGAAAPPGASPHPIADAIHGAIGARRAPALTRIDGVEHADSVASSEAPERATAPLATEHGQP